MVVIPVPVPVGKSVNPSSRRQEGNKS